MEQNERQRITITPEMVSALESSTTKHHAVHDLVGRLIPTGPAIVDVQDHRGEAAKYLHEVVFLLTREKDLLVASSEALYEKLSQRFHENIDGTPIAYRFHPNPEKSLAYFGGKLAPKPL